MTIRALAAAATAVLLLGAAPADLRVRLQDAAKAYYADMAHVAPIAGRENTYDYYDRLLNDVAMIDSGVPAGYTQEMWERSVEGISTLDLDAVSQLMKQSYRPMSSIRGLGETFVRSSKDGTMQPVAVYVPSTYTPEKPMPLVVFLHGHPMSESQMIGPAYIGELAERTGTIIVAPYGRGYYDFRGSIADVYDARDAAMQAFSIDMRKRYLVGYSMGGFSVFEVAPLHPNDWAAVMCIAGALLGHDSRSIVTTMHSTPFYVLTGTADDSIPTQYPTITAAYLQMQGMNVGFYSLPGGLHRLVTLLPILTKAWGDMESGVVRAPPPFLGNFALPSAVPPSTMKT